MAFFAIPLCRWALNRSANAAAAERNLARKEAESLLRLPPPALRAKLAFAREQSLASRVLIGDRDIVYDSSKPLEEQAVDPSAAAFDERMERRGRERQGLDLEATGVPELESESGAGAGAGAGAPEESGALEAEAGGEKRVPWLAYEEELRPGERSGKEGKGGKGRRKS